MRDVTMLHLGEPEVRRVTLYFDPACPWTWRTSRWLLGAAAARRVPVEYAPFELAAGKPFDELPAVQRRGAMASRRFLRTVAAARNQQRHDLIGRWYTAFGNARWHDRAEPTAEMVLGTLAAAGGVDLAETLDDARFDDVVAQSRHEALEWAGDDAGSPVTVWDVGHERRGFFGPVVAPQPTGHASDALWDAVVTVAGVGRFFELKARRVHSPTDPDPEPESIGPIHVREQPVRSGSAGASA